MPDEEVYLHSAVVLTALPVEYQAVREHLTDLHLEKHQSGNIYQRGTFIAGRHQWNVGIVEVGAGNVSAAVQTERAISHFKPILILFVGVAGGLKDVSLGDVVVATKVYGYESGKAHKTFQPRPEVRNIPYRMLELARSEARTNDWLKRLPTPIPEPAPRVFVAPIAAGGSVVTSMRSAIMQRLREYYSDAVAVEMEGYGFFHAVYTNPGLDALIIRGISDLIDNKSQVHDQRYQELAARHASAFAFEILAKLDTRQHLHPTDDETTAAPLSKEGQPPGERKEQQNPLQPEIFPSQATKNQLIDRLRNVISEEYDVIGAAFSPFDSEQELYPDQCDRAIKVLNDLDQHLRELSGEAKILVLAMEYDLDNMVNALSELLVALHKFHALCPPGKALVKRRQYTTEHEKIRNEKKNLLQRLERFKIRLSSET